MIILFVCNYFPSLITTNYIVKELLNLQYDITIINTGSNFNRKAIVPISPIVKFYSYDAFNILHPIIKKMDIKLEVLTYKELVTQSNKISYFEFADINSNNKLNQMISTSTFHGAVSVRFNQIFNDSMVEIIKNKGFFWNIHGGLLPEYKGLMGVARALLNAETSIGWSIHEISKKVDQGNIISSIKVKKNHKMSVLEYEILLAQAIVKKFIMSLKQKDNITMFPNRYTLGDTYSNLTKSELLELENMGILFSNEQSFVSIINDLSENLSNLSKESIIKHLNQYTKNINH